MSLEHAERVQVKIFADKAPQITDFIPVFHAWIRDKRLSGDTLVDVADYSHVHHGPGVMLVGHAADWYFDEHEGRPGLLFSRKRAFEGNFEARLEDAVRQAAFACLQIEKDVDALFNASELWIRVPDRLHISNDAAGFKAARPVIEKILKKLIPNASIELSHEGDARASLTVRAKLSGETLALDDLVK